MRRHKKKNIGKKKKVTSKRKNTSTKTRKKRHKKKNTGKKKIEENYFRIKWFEAKCKEIHARYNEGKLSEDRALAKLKRLHKEARTPAEREIVKYHIATLGG